MAFSLRPYQAPDFQEARFRGAAEAALVPAPADGIAPTGYHAMSIFPEYFKINGQWLLAKESRMDCVPVFEDGEIRVREFRLLKKDDLVVVGHTHRYEAHRLGGVLLLNPGSCGPRRFNQAITMALAEITPSPAGRPEIAVTRIDIEHQGPRRRVSGDLKAQIETVIRETTKGRPAVDIASRRGWDVALVEQIARLYVTHPGVDADGIMAKMGL